MSFGRVWAVRVTPSITVKKTTKVLLLENIHPIARDIFLKHGCDVEAHKGAWSDSELKDKLSHFDILGIRSKTQIRAEVLQHVSNLQAIGCFCVGTNQVDLPSAKMLGIPVFNAPFSNTRSVAEMTISNLVSLSRKIAFRSQEMHQKIWKKESEGCFEVRGKTLGLVGYGNVGTQVSHLAETMGLRVVFYDIIEKLPLGNSEPMRSLSDLLAISDYVSLHVPETIYTQGMMGAEEIKMMKKGSYLLNASRGTVVDVDALASALKSGHLAGAAVDVFPEEPEKNTTEFQSVLQGISNVILTPHIGGATEEAQTNIGREVASSLVRFLQSASTPTAVNFPKIDMQQTRGAHRFLNVHKNVPGVLKEINRIVSESGANILGQSLSTDAEIGYLVMDLSQPLTNKDIESIQKSKGMIRTLSVGT